MKKNDMQIENLIREGIKNTDVPENLRKENIVEMLKEQKDFSDKTGSVVNIDAARDTASKRGASVVTLRRMATAAAAFVIVIACVLFARMNTGVRVIRTEPEFENYNSENLIIGVSSYDEVEKAVQNVLQKAENVPASTRKPSDKEQASSKVTQAQSGQQGSSGYVIDDSVILETAVSAYNAGGDFIEEITGLEADIVKNNGEYLFIVTTGEDASTGGNVELIRVVRALPAEEMSVVSTIVLSDNSSAKNIDECAEIYLKDNKLVAIMRRNAYVMEDNAAFDKHSTVALFYDISKPDAPVKLREHIQDGKYLTSGISESGGLYLITEKSVTASEKDSIPSFSINGVETKPGTDDIFMAMNDPEAAFTFITVTDINDLTKPTGCLAFFGSNSGRLYISGDSVLLSRSFISVEADENGNHENMTEIYRFDINASGAEFMGSYAVNGTLSGKPEVDKAKGWLAVVSTDSEATSLYVLNEKMEFVSGLQGIFSNEKIEGVKFFGVNCYIVSGEKSETTMIIDLTNPEKPRKIATLSTQGLAGRLFRAGDELLINVDGSKGGEVLKDISVSLLDLSDPLNPGSLDLYNLSGVYDGSTVFDSKSIMVMAEEKLLGIPVIRTDPSTGEAVSAYALFEFSNSDIKPIGYFNHETKSDGETAVRGTCIGDIFYSVSGSKVVAFSISGEARLASVELK